MGLSRCGLLAAAAWVALPCTSFAQNRVEGVNPADLLTQIQFTSDFNDLGNGASQWGITGKYDYSFKGAPVGLNFELPLYLHASGPGFSDSGNGDLFTRGRYIRQMGRWSLGAAMEVVVPVGSDAFSARRWQTNPAVLAVYAWDQSNLTALVHKRVFGYLSTDDDRPDLNQYQWRAIQIHIRPTGWFGQIDLSGWRDVISDQDWLETRFSVGKQVSATARLQGEIKKLSGDRENNWALSVSYAVKL
jgi:hypothetical protein